MKQEKKKGRCQTYGLKVFLKPLDVEIFSPSREILTQFIICNTTLIHINHLRGNKCSSDEWEQIFSQVDNLKL